MISALLARYAALDEAEVADLARMRRLADSEPDPWSRSLPLHFTASAVVVHPDSGRVLLRWHQRQRMWLQAGGHGDPGETDPLAIALREAREETSLPDLVPWPDGALRHAVVCRVAPGKGEPAHEHADVRFIVATSTPEAARPESPDAPLRWVTIAEARDLVGTNNLRRTLDRAESLLALPGQLEHPGGDVRPRQRDARRRSGRAMRPVATPISRHGWRSASSAARRSVSPAMLSAGRARVSS